MSSHMPWNRVPDNVIPWNQVGDGSIFNHEPTEKNLDGAFWVTPKRVRASYAHSIEYSMNTIVSFVKHYGRKNLVMIVVGDDQPLPIVSGEGASHDVPISIISHDPKVLAADQELGLGRRAATPAERAGLADERVPRPLPHRLRLETGAAIARDAELSWSFDRAPSWAGWRMHGRFAIVVFARVFEMPLSRLADRVRALARAAGAG